MGKPRTYGQAAYRHVCGGMAPEKVEAALRRIAEYDKAGLEPSICAEYKKF